MCGFFSVFAKSSFSEDFKSYAPKILFENSYRGPDNSSYLFINDNIFLGANRLRIIDNDTRGDMPLKSLMGDFWITFNGEVYNYKDLKKELEQNGIKFFTSTDTEVVLNSYVFWGEEFVSKLNGIFAFVIFDKNKDKIIFSRDRFGAKPLYYYKSSEVIGFSSDFLSLKKMIPKNELDIDLDSLTANILCRFVPGYKTIFKNIYKVEPAELLIFKISDLDIVKTKYWEPNIELKEFSQEEFNEKLSSALVKTSIADVKPSILLSGGIDSSALVCEIFSSTKEEINTYSCNFKSSILDENLLDTSKITNGTLDESKKAFKISNKFNTKHDNVIIDSLISNEIFSEMQEALGEPIAVTNSLGLYLFAKKLKKKTRLVLSGTGSDELLGGYEELYYNDVMEDRSILSNNELFDLFCDYDNGDIHPLNSLKKDLHSTDYLEKYLNNTLKVFGDEKLSKEYINQLSLFELGFALPYWELDMADRLFMSNSIELRPSFLENDFFDYCLTIPSIHKKEKNPLKIAMSGKLPPDIINQKKVPSLSTPIDFLKSECFIHLIEDLKNDPLDIWDKEFLSTYLEKPYDELSFDVLYRIVYLQSWLKNNYYKDYNFIKVINN